MTSGCRDGMAGKASLAAVGLVAFLGVQSPVATAAVDLSMLRLAPSPANGVRMGPLTIFPSLGLGTEYDNNYLRTSVKEIGTWIYLLSPGIKATAVSGPNEYNLSYRALMGFVSTNSDWNYVDQDVKADANWELGLRHRLRAEYQFLSGYDQPGTSDPDESSRPNFSDSLDKWRSNRVGGTYTYGAPGARGRLELGAQQSWRRYVNNNQEYRDYDGTRLVATFYARVQPKTSLLLELGNDHINYVNEGSGIFGYSDQNQPRAYVGVTWEATGKTTGTAKVGYLAVNFQDSDYSNWSGVGWDVGVTWEPKTYSKLTLNTSRTPQQSGVQTDDIVIVSALTAAWSHAWSSRVSSKLGGYIAADDYRGFDSRTDHRYGISGGLAYNLQNWVQLGAVYQYERRNSDFDFDNYKDNIFRLTANLRY